MMALFLAGEKAEAASPLQTVKVKADAFLRQRQLDSAIPLYQRIIRKDGAFANAHYNLATAYFLQGEIAQAAKSLETFLALRPDDGEALYNLGCLKLRLGNFVVAEGYFQKAAGCLPTPLLHQKIKEALQLLKGLRQPNSA